MSNPRNRREIKNVWTDVDWSWNFPDRNHQRIFLDRYRYCPLTDYFHTVQKIRLGRQPRICFCLTVTFERGLARGNAPRYVAPERHGPNTPQLILQRKTLLNGWPTPSDAQGSQDHALTRVRLALSRLVAPLLGTETTRGELFHLRSTARGNPDANAARGRIPDVCYYD